MNGRRLALLVATACALVVGTTASASSDSPFVVTRTDGGASLVGIARRDVARVILLNGAAPSELALDARHGFAVPEVTPGAPVQLEALAADGSPLGGMTLPAIASAQEQQRASGTIGWLFRHEPRGRSLAAAGIRLGSTVGSHWQPVKFARALTPDPTSRARIVLSLIGKRGRNVCLTIFPTGGGPGAPGAGGCAVGLTLTPLSITTADVAGRGFIAGAAADGVERIVVQFVGGEQKPVPLSDNVFYIRVAASRTPRRLVSYDGAGNVVGTQRLLNPQLPRLVQSAAAKGYTIANRGEPVRPRGSTRFFGDHSYRLFLLGTAGERAFYRIEVTAHFTCWGSGPRSTIGKVGVTGCPALVGAYPLQFDDNAVELKPANNEPHTFRLGGIVVDQAVEVALEDAKGAVLKKVEPRDNLYSFSPPFPRGFVRAVPLDAAGKPLPPHPGWGEHQTPPPNLFGPRATTVAPSALGPVVQHGEARGVRVSIDEQGTVLFDARSIDPKARGALGNKSAWFACFQLSGQNVRHNRSAGITTKFKAEIAFKLIGIKPHYDGCEAGGSYGHRWHDAHGPHSVIEIALTQQGVRYFEDRATARDLAAFVRSAKTQAIRRATGPSLLHAIRRAYGDQVTVLRSASATAAPGRVGVWTRGAHTVFSERSHLDDRLYVELEHGKIVRDNVRGLAFVF